MPFFSVIIPLFNKENFIEATLNSVLNQTFIDFEIVIVDDGSTDKGAVILKKFTDSRISYYYKDNGGVSTARNLGLKIANAEYITFLDADDYWYPEFLTEMFKNIQLFPRHKVFSAAIEIATSKKVFAARYSVEKISDRQIVNYFEASINETVICTSCAVFNKNVFNHVGNFDEEIKSGQDTDMWIRIGLKYPVVFFWNILARYVYDENSLSKNKKFLNQKINFSKFKQQEKKDAKLKKFLDLNRFSLAIKSKIAGDYRTFQQYYKAIDSSNLGLKKILLLELPPIYLRQLIRLKLKLTNIGLGSSVFR